jgi:hypothetical protein
LRLGENVSIKIKALLEAVLKSANV